MEEIVERYENEEYEHQEVKPVQTGLYYVWSTEEGTHIVSPIDDGETYYTVRKEVICDCDDFDGSCVHTDAVQEAIERQEDIDGDDPITRAVLRKRNYTLQGINEVTEEIEEKL